MSKRILFFGNERLATGVTTATPTLKALLAAGYEVSAVIIAQNETAPSRKSRPLEVTAVAKANNIPVVSPPDLSKSTDEIASFDAQAAVLVAYGKIVPPAILKLFPAGIINIHPSLLPLHRGPTPIENVILNGEAETGVSLMKLIPEMDAGPVYAQQAVGLDGTETKQELADRLAIAGKDLLLNHLPGILDASLTSKSQNEGATYDKPLSKADGVLDFSKPAERLAREIQAYAGWPRSQTKIGVTDVIITSAQVLKGRGEPGEVWIENKQLGIYTADGILVINSLIPAGKKEMSAEAFIAGYRLN